MDINTKISKAKLALLAMQRKSWEQGVAMQAFYEMDEYETVFALAKEAAYRTSEDGRVAVIDSNTAITDPCSTGETLLFSAKKTNDQQMIKAYDGLLDWALNKAPRNSEGIVYHMTYSKEFWVDTLYMLPPFLVVAGYPEEARKQIEGTWTALYNTQKGLLSHMWDDDKKVFSRKAFWGVGNGWAMASFSRIIDLLPKEMHEYRNILINRNIKLIDEILKYIRPDGLSYDVLDDPSTFIDTNLPQMLGYSIYRGIRSGWLSPSYKENADKCRIAAENKVDDFGLVQDVCGAPHFDHPGVAAEGQAFFLLMENEYKLLNNTNPRLIQ